MNAIPRSFNARNFFFSPTKLRPCSRSEEACERISLSSVPHAHRAAYRPDGRLAVRFSIYVKALMTRSAFLAISLLLLSISTSHAAWTTAHGNADNTGFARVDTQPAARAASVVNVGRVTPGANPVTGPDGTVYVGNVKGELIALHPDGSPFWKRQLNEEHGPIVASPVVGSDGSVYVVSSYKFRDHRGGVVRYCESSYLHKFNSTGAWLGWTLFPASSWPDCTRGLTSAPPNIWRHNGVEAVMVPVVYAGVDVRLVAFSTGLVVLGDVLVTRVPVNNDITGEAPSFDLGPLRCYYLIFCGIPFHPPTSVPPFAEAGWPTPGVAIWEYPQGSPYIWVADNWKSTVAYKFDPASGFSEIYRFTDKQDRLSSPPVALNNIVAVVGAETRLKFERQGFEIGWFDGLITAAPTRMADGRLVIIERSGGMTVVNGTAVVNQQPLNGQSIASAAASCTHLFVSSTNELVTFDATNMMPVARVAWTGGGRHAPIIGPLGHVYAMTESGRQSGLFVFPPKQPKFRTGGLTARTACDQGTVGGTLLLKR